MDNLKSLEIIWIAIKIIFFRSVRVGNFWSRCFIGYGSNGGEKQNTVNGKS